MAQRERVAPLHAAPLAACAVAAAVVLGVVMLVAVGIGSVSVPLVDTWRIVTVHLTGVPPAGDVVADQIVWRYRVPRVLLAALCGAGLSVAGVILQALVANPLADPHVLGVAPGASLGAVLALTLGGAAVGGIGVSAAAFLGALLALALVFAVAQRGGRLTPTRLVLSGVAFGYVFLAATSYLQLRATPNELRTVLFWLLGSVAGAQWAQLRVVGIAVIAATVLLALYGRRLNALLAGDESATALGVDVRRTRLVLLVLSSLLIGTLIAVSGVIGFVGLMIPHLVRLTFGADHRRALPLAALLGATYLVLVDLLSRTVDSPNELPLGIFTAGLGAPFLLWLLRHNQSMAHA